MSNSKGIAKTSLLLNTSMRTQALNSAKKQEIYSRLRTDKGKNISEYQETKDRSNKYYSLYEKLREKSIDSPSINKTFNYEAELEKPSHQKIIVKRKMKWKDYLESQVSKQRKINEDLEKTLKAEIKKIQKKNTENASFFKTNIITNELEKDIENLKTADITDNIKKLDEQECFYEDTEGNVLQSPEIKNKIKENEQEKTKDNSSNIENFIDFDDIFTDEDKRVQEILERYTKTMGKSKLKEIIKRIESPKYLLKSPNKRSKSSYSEYKTNTRREAEQKIRVLESEEERIKKQKEELISFLESRSHVRHSSRPTTVASLMTRKENIKIEHPLGINHNNPMKSGLPNINTCKNERINLLHTRCKSINSKKKKDKDSHVKNLISNLF
ncbi:hypothetical protein SteCoe_11441 [Stentor coeruleus]|uniref:Uncharacterized protein n=1 Tax=Stentor coeruleus TaxID=5963 RepID=A0A1R2CCZ1_9CILI|nr:hypothetical protein SteCoe_11441 [Stentor coeruleus]